MSEQTRQLTVTRPSRTIAAASAAMVVPAIIADAGDQAASRSCSLAPAVAKSPPLARDQGAHRADDVPAGE